LKTPVIISTTSELDDPVSEGELASELEIRQLNFSLVEPGSRLDVALVALVPEFSRSYLQQLVQLGAVSVNGKRIGKTAQKIRVSDRGSIELRPTPQSQAFRAEAIPIEIMFSDEHLLVINKPAGMVVHPAPGNWSGTLMNAVLGLDAKAFHLPRAGIVHRLDKDTSGLMVVARTRQTMDALVHAIAARQVKRQYLALGHNPWAGPRQRSVASPIGRDPSNRLKMAVVDLARYPGKAAQTDFASLGTVDEGCLVHCTLHTGRTHQIRVHMASIGHPLVADATYGGRPLAGMRRQALHAYHLGFDHPVDARAMAFHAPIPNDFAEALMQWGIHYNEAETGH
jgi:23S rRNA pseudouridine1911/1915/1917 synthase